eukprot:scaffold86849_cov17-Tisochrysis_lutea.AAC.1
MDAAAGTSSPSDLAATHAPVSSTAQGAGFLAASPQSPSCSAEHGLGHSQQAWAPAPSPSAAHEDNPSATADGGMHSADSHQAQQLNPHHTLASPEQAEVEAAPLQGSDLERAHGGSPPFPSALGMRPEPAAAPTLSPSASAADSLGGLSPRAGSLLSPSASTAESLGGPSPSHNPVLLPSVSAAD